MLIACSEQPAANTDAKVNMQAADTTLDPVPPALASVPSPILAPVNFQQWQAIQQAATPNIVVVDLWATWCAPCLERFPHMVNLSQQFANRGVQFMSLSLDDRDDSDALDFGRDFLQQQDAGFPHYLLDEELLDGFEKLGLQTVPAVDVYHRDGSLSVRFTGDNPNKPFDEEDIATALESLLGNH